MAQCAHAATPSRRSSQRRRLLAAISELAIAEEYATVSVGEVIAQAGVSRATFYEYFKDRDECFVATLEPLGEELLAAVHAAVAGGRPEHAASAAVDALTAFAASRPGPARLLMCDALTGGSRARDARERLIDDAAAIIADAHRRASPEAAVADLSPALICAVTCRLLGSRLRDAEPRLRELCDGLIAWLASYRVPLTRHRWRELAALPAPARSPLLLQGILRTPPARPSGRVRKADAPRPDENWLRIVLATAEVVAGAGYADATVVEITQAAAVDSRAFYRLFASKQQALVAACELFFRHAVAVTAGAFVAGDGWPEHVWEGARALLQFAQENPTLLYVSLVETAAGGAGAIACVEARTRAFEIFLRDEPSHLHERVGRATGTDPDIALDAVVTATFELAYRHVREGNEAPLSSLLAPVAFLSLAPSMGAESAADFISRHESGGGEGPLLASAA